MVVSLVPDLLGDMVVNWDTFTVFKREFGSEDPVLPSNGWNSWEQLSPGPRCLMPDTGIRPGCSDQVDGCTTQLYTDGAACSLCTRPTPRPATADRSHGSGPQRQWGGRCGPVHCAAALKERQPNGLLGGLG